MSGNSHLLGLGAALCIALPAQAGDLKDLLAGPLTANGSLERLGDFTFSMVNDRIAPLSGSGGGYAYEYDEDLDAYEHSTWTTGSFQRSARTLGRGRFLAGFSQTFVEFDELDGTDLADLRSSDLRDFANLGASPSYTLDLEVEQSVSTVHLAYGVTDRLEIGLVVPFVNVEIDARAAFDPLPSAEFPPSPSGRVVVLPAPLPTNEDGMIDPSHIGDLIAGTREVCTDTNFRAPDGSISTRNICFRVPLGPGPGIELPSPTTDPALLPVRSAASVLGAKASDSYTGLGDAVVRGKWQFLADGSTNAALVASLSLPTGDEDNLAGLGAFSFTPGVVFSRAFEAAPLGLGLRGFAGYRVRDDDSDRSGLEWSIGGSIRPFGRLRMSIDMMGSQELSGDRVDLFDLALGMQLRLGEQWLLGVDYLKPLNDEGLRASNGIALARLQWTFGD